MRIINRIAAVFIFTCFLAAYYTALEYPQTAAAYPKLLLVWGMIFCVALFVQSFFERDEESDFEITKINLIKLLVSLFLMGVYFVSIPVVGYAVTTFAYMFVQMWLINMKSKIKVLFPVAFVTTVVLYVSFGMFLNVWLPKGILF